MSFLVTITGGQLSGYTAAILALTIPLLAAGVLFGWLTENDRLPSFGRALLFWAGAFTVSRLIQQLLIAGPHPKDGLIGFVLYQVIVGLLFGLGFMLLYQQVLAGFSRLLGEPGRREVERDTEPG